MGLRKTTCSESRATAASMSCDSTAALNRPATSVMPPVSLIFAQALKAGMNEAVLGHARGDLRSGSQRQRNGLGGRCLRGQRELEDALPCRCVLLREPPGRVGQAVLLAQLL